METVYAATAHDITAGPATPGNATGNTPTTWTTDTGNTTWGYGVYNMAATVNPVTAVGAGTLRLFVRARPDTSSGPTVSAEIRNTVAVTETLAAQTVTSTSGQWLSWPVDQTLLTAGVIRVAVQGQNGGGKPSDRDTVQLAVIELTLDTAPLTAGTNLNYWDGTAWTAAPLKRWDGTAWQPATVQRWDGATWGTV